MKKNLLLLLILCSTAAFSQNINVYPKHWWPKLNSGKLQLMLYADEQIPATFTSKNKGIKIISVYQPENKKYLFVDLDVSKAKPGTYNFSIGNKELSYTLKDKRSDIDKSWISGIDNSDLMYLIMPDRFSNGDPSNDKIPGLLDQTLNRDSIFHRHGGDLKGVENNLDYLTDLGVTAIWLNPVLENNMPERSEHGYAATNHYFVDKRLGGDEAYRELAETMHSKGLKLIQDVVYNHVGTEHFLFKDLPDSTWFNFWPEYTNTSYRDQVWMDTYVSEIDKKKMSDGWFVPSMPDVNQRNPYFANYLIQHALWYTEEYGVDGWRIDTYPYNDLEFMNRCNEILLREYPGIFIFGETWVHGVPNQAFFMRNNLNLPFKSNLPSTTDFQLALYGILSALTQPTGWMEGVNRLYATAAQDFVYQQPNLNVIFLDNHDKSRIFSELGENPELLKMALSWLLTFRGIPQLYYGTEIGMKGFSNPDGWVRLDFPGGWKEDKENKFTKQGRNTLEEEIHNHVKTLAGFRKNSSALTTGKFMHYIPEDGVYVYFRYSDNQTIMCIMNPEKKSKNININRFYERTNGFNEGRDVISGEILNLQTLKVPAEKLLVLELQ